MEFRTRATAIVVHNEKLLTFKAIDPFNQKEYFFLPGGAIEATETAPECAERECLEETGFLIEVDPLSCKDVEYPFVWNGKEFHCLTLFYKASLKSFIQQERSSEEPSYNLGPHWIPLAEVKDIFAYSPAIQETVLEMILTDSL